MRWAQGEGYAPAGLGHHSRTWVGRRTGEEQTSPSVSQGAVAKAGDLRLGGELCSKVVQAERIVRSFPSHYSFTSPQVILNHPQCPAPDSFSLTICLRDHSVSARKALSQSFVPLHGCLIIHLTNPLLLHMYLVSSLLLLQTSGNDSPCGRVVSFCWICEIKFLGDN